MEAVATALPEQRAPGAPVTQHPNVGDAAKLRTQAQEVVRVSADTRAPGNQAAGQPGLPAAGARGPAAVQRPARPRAAAAA